MPTTVGDRAPEVTLISHELKPVSLSDYRGKSALVVLFFPLAFTSTCTEELCTVGEDMSAYHHLGAEVVAISVDSPYALERFRRECGADYPFLSDFHREAAEAFGVLRTSPLGAGLRNVADRAAFIISRDGVITYAWHSTNPSLIPPFEELKEALAKERLRVES